MARVHETKPTDPIAAARGLLTDTDKHDLPGRSAPRRIIDHAALGFEREATGGIQREGIDQPLIGFTSRRTGRLCAGKLGKPHGSSRTRRTGRPRRPCRAGIPLFPFRYELTLVAPAQYERQSKQREKQCAHRSDPNARFTSRYHSDRRIPFVGPEAYRLWVSEDHAGRNPPKPLPTRRISISFDNLPWPV